MSCLGASGRLRTEGVPHTYTGCKYSRCVPLKLCVFCFPDVVITRTIRDGRGERKLSSPTESGISLIIVILRLLLLPVIIRCDPLESLALLFPSMSQAWELLCPRCQPVPLDDKGRKGKLAGSPTVNKTRHWVHRACQGGVVMPPRHSDYWRRCCRVFGNKQVLSKWLMKRKNRKQQVNLFILPCLHQITNTYPSFKPRLEHCYTIQYWVTKPKVKRIESNVKVLRDKKKNTALLLNCYLLQTWFKTTC